MDMSCHFFSTFFLSLIRGLSDICLPGRFPSLVAHSIDRHLRRRRLLPEPFLEPNLDKFLTHSTGQHDTRLRDNPTNQLRRSIIHTILHL